MGDTLRSLGFVSGLSLDFFIETATFKRLTSGAAVVSTVLTTGAVLAWCAAFGQTEPLGQFCTLSSQACLKGILTCYYSCVEIEPRPY